MHATIGDLLRQLHSNQKPYLDISQSLNGLAPFPGIAADASHVLPNTVNCLCAVLSVEEPCICGRIWKKEVNEYRPRNSDSTKNQEYSLGQCQQPIRYNRHRILTFQGAILCTWPTA